MPLRLRDVWRAGIVSADLALWHVELSRNHAAGDRRFVAKLVPPDAVGAEIGVFTGLFSAVLLDVARPREIYFVDVWWKEFGERFPDWGRYTANGRLTTRTAHVAAARRIARHARGTRCHVVVDYAVPFLAGLPEGHLDWAYLDTSHTYENTREELHWLATRLKPGGILIGDDWDEDPSSIHHGVVNAVTEAVEQGAFEDLRTYPFRQWSIRAR